MVNRIKTKMNDLLYNIKKHPKNVFSVTRGLKGYSVGKKRFPATREGYIAAHKEMSKRGVGASIHYHYI